MTVLSLTKPFETDVPFLLVENKLKVGTHAFRLVVVDDDGTESEPMDAVVQIRDATTLIPRIIASPTATKPINPSSPAKPAVKPAAPTTPTIPPRGKGKPK